MKVKLNIINSELKGLVLRVVEAKYEDNTSINKKVVINVTVFRQQQAQEQQPDYNGNNQILFFKKS